MDQNGDEIITDMRNQDTASKTEQEHKVTRSGRRYDGKQTIDITAEIENQPEDNNSEDFEEDNTEIIEESRVVTPARHKTANDADTPRAKKLKALQARLRVLKAEQELLEFIAAEDSEKEIEVDPRCDVSQPVVESEDDVPIVHQNVEDLSPTLSNDLRRKSSTDSRSSDLPHIPTPEPIQPDVFQHILMSQTQFMDKMLKQQQQNALALKLPNSEVPTFNGDPLEYSGFIRAFENIIETKTEDDNARLYYLVQYTSGEVKEVMRSCLSMKPTEGYNEARRLLKKRFGQNYRIASAYVDRLTQGPPIKSEDGEALQKLSTALTTCKNALKEIGYISKIESADSLKKVVNRLPYDIRRRWRTVADTIAERYDREITLDDVVEFVDKEARITTHPVFGNLHIHNANDSRDRSYDKKRTPQYRSSGSSFFSQVDSRQSSYSNYSSPMTGKSPGGCPQCNSDHPLSSCNLFQRLPLEERAKIVMIKGLCFNCLYHGHRSKHCKSKFRCKECHGRHHTLLHQPTHINDVPCNTRKAPDTMQDTTAIANVKNGFSQTYCTSTDGRSPFIGLPVATVKVKTNGQITPITIRSLLDNGSNSTFCTNRLLRKLGIEGQETSISLNTIDKEDSVNESRIVSLQIYDLDETHLIDLPFVFSRPSIPLTKSDVPIQEDIEEWPHFKDVNLPNIDADVDLLIGNDNISALEPIEIRPSKDGSPYAIRTKLGWVVNGPLNRKTFCKRHTANFIKCDERLSEQFKEFCNREFNDSIVEINKEMSQEDHKAMSIMEQTVKLNQEKHYEIALPWKSYPPCMPDNKPLAEHRLHLLKRRLLTDPNLFDKYSEFIDNLLDNGYAEKIDPDEKSVVPNWYLPHHPVFNPQKPGKIRVVYDCSARYHGISLNECLLQGPNLTNTLVGVLSRFRQQHIALLADIEAMFHQVHVPMEHRNALRFLWWPENDIKEEPSTYRMKVHLFGAVSSPSCCNFALLQTVNDTSNEELISCIQRNFYVDDFLKSTATEDEAKEIARDLRELLSRQGFRLTKWISNSQDVLNSIPESERAIIQDHKFEEAQVQRTLGIRWDVATDSFGFDISIQPRPATRRGILSIVSSIFDPLGFVAPFTLPAKMILQDLCRLQYGWDVLIPEDFLRRWNAWLIDLPKLAKFNIQRCIIPKDFDEVVKYQLHHFSDASEVGFGSVSYVRTVSSTGKIYCAFMIGKSRLTPLKKITIPRLELSAATISVRLDKILRQELEIPIQRSFFWTDSTSVIKYINNETKRFHTFVANRIARIRDGSDPSDWFYVDTKLNPSDQSSRGVTANELIKNQSWILGPGFLYLPENEWPRQPDVQDSISSDDPEVKIEKKCNLVVGNDVDIVNRIFNRFSSWFRLKRCIAYILRYKKNLLTACRNKVKGDNPATLKNTNFQPLTVEEIISAELEILKYIQKEIFHEEFMALSQNQHGNVKKSSNIRKLDPFFSDGLIRVGGRLRHATMSFESKHPIILPKNHHISTLIIRHFHHLSGHSGREYVISMIRKKFWIIKINSAVRSILSKCISCRKRQAKPIQQKFADLPEDRVTAEKPPFTFVGIDFFGPFLIKRGRSQLKRYGCIFTCLAVRAVHIEVTHSLDTDSFINALRRFIARRGVPSEIRTDNGTNFVGGNRELKSAIDDWNQKRINDFLLQKYVKWIFNTPAASHHGGVWERCIRTVRKVLNALMTEQILDDEGLSTLMCEVEGIINGRPITPVSDDVQDMEALTPNHLLLLRSEPTLSPGVFIKQDLYSRKRWRQVQYMADLFWKRWRREYLPLLQIRQRFINPNEHLKINDMVLLVDDSLPRVVWPLARIIAVVPGKDGLIRSVKVKTKTTVLERPVTKCVLLESTKD